MRRVTVVLLNLGGPSDLSSVRPFLFNLFYDRAIIDLSNPWRWILALLISWLRQGKAKKIYEKIGGKSPLLQETEKQAFALSKFLENRKGFSFQFLVSMRYWMPFSSEVVKKISDFKTTDVVLIPLYPQFSKTTTKSSMDDFKLSLEGIDWTGNIHILPCFFSLRGFLDFLENKVRLEYEKAKKYGDPIVLWTAHGLPEKIINKGDPYQKQMEETVRLLKERLQNMGKFHNVLCYQSRLGPVKWIGPNTIDEIKKAGEQKKPVIVVPISFVSEHSETLVELDMEYKEIAISEGVPFYGRIPTVGTHPLFMEGLSEEVIRLLNFETVCLFKDLPFCCAKFN